MNKIFMSAGSFLGMASLLCLMALGFHSCSNDPDEPIIKKKVEKTIQLSEELTPETIEVELREGHSHLKNNPELGELYWSLENSGFHANPYYDEESSQYPFRTKQTMVFSRQPDGSYAIDRAKSSTDVFRVQTSPTSGGVWQALLVYMYDKKGNRIDLNFRKEGMRDRTQLFYSISDVQKILQTRPSQGIDKADTCVTIDYNYAGLSKETEAAIKKLVGDEVPMIYHTTAHAYNKETPNDSVFYYYYYDRETDDVSKSPVLQNPIGFRGTIANRIPFASYNVNMKLTVLPEGSAKTKPYSNVPTKEQLQNVVFNLSIPFRNIMEKYDANVSFPQPVMDILKKDSAYDEYLLQDIVGNDNVVMGMHINVLREYPKHTLRELKEWYEEQLRNSNPEASNFWL